MKILLVFFLLMPAIISCKNPSSFTKKDNNDIAQSQDADYFYRYSYAIDKSVYLDKNFKSNCSIGDIATIMNIITHASIMFMPTNKPFFIENANYEKETLTVRVSLKDGLYKYDYRFKYKNGKWHLDGIGLLDIYY